MTDTERLDWLCRMTGQDPILEWWFGSESKQAHMCLNTNAHEDARYDGASLREAIDAAMAREAGTL